MMRRLVPLGALVAYLPLVAGCQNETSSPSVLPDVGGAATSGPLALHSVSKLTNPGPECPGARTPGFFCQNQDGKNPNLPLPEFLDLAAEAATLLQSLDALASTNVAGMVCFKGNSAPEDQLLRHLSALALNLAANLIDETTPLSDGSFPTVGDALAAAIAVANDPDATKQERNAVKDVLDDINNNVNTVLGDECVGDDEGDGEGGR
jgi:hypothetical protein